MKSHYNKINLPNHKNPKPKAQENLYKARKAVGKEGFCKKKRSLTKKLDVPVFGPPHVKEDDGYIYINGTGMHVIVWKAHYGIIPQGWHVHHIDKNRKNNNIENLVAIPAEFHRAIHRGGKLPKRPALMRVYYKYFDKYLTLQRQRDQLVKELVKLDAQLVKVGANITLASPRTSDEHIERMKQVNRDKLGSYYGHANTKYPKLKPVEFIPRVVVPETVSNVRDLGYDPLEEEIETPIYFNRAPISLSDEALEEFDRIRGLINEVKLMALSTTP